MKKKKFDGILIYYWATGEQGRVQFIGRKSLNEKGLVVNNDEIFDIDTGDKIKLHLDNFKETEIIVTEDTRMFLYHLLRLIEGNEVSVEYKPSKDTKSWAQILKKIKN